MSSFRTGFSGPLLVVLLVLAVWGLGRAGLLDLAGGLIYDPLMRHGITLGPESSRVLVVQAPGRRLGGGAATWAHLLETLEALRPAQVVFAFYPPEADRAFYRRCQELGRVTFGRQVRNDARAGGGPRLPPRPAAAAGLDLPEGVVARPPSDGGVTRLQRATVRLAGRALPALERVAAERVLGEGAALPDGNYRIDFLGGPERLPWVRLERVLAGGLVPALTQGRAVLVGYIPREVGTGVHTPVSGTEHGRSLLELQAFALDTLLGGRAIRGLGAGLDLLLIGVLSTALILFLQWLSLRWALLLTAALALVVVAGAWLSLSLAQVWPPVAELLLTLLLGFALVFYRKASAEEQALHRALMETSAQLRERVIPPSFYASEAHWNHVANLVNQTLELRRLIFLERVEADHRVREVEALHCSLEDIDERRRDYYRTPYSTAVAANGPIHLEQVYLEPIEGPEEQYLVPLIYAGELLGFWAFGVDPAKAAQVTNFHSMVADFADQIAEMLYHRARWLAEQAAAGNQLGRYLRLQGWEGTHRSLYQSVQLLERRLVGLENVFDGIGTATILYDLFGRVLQVNRQMQEVLTEAGLAFYDQTAVDLLCAITGKDLSEGRQYLHYVILERTVITLPAVAVSGQHRTYVLHVRPLEQQHDRAEREGSEPFRLAGILLELADISIYQMLCELKKRLLERLNFRLRNDMEAILLATDMIAEARQGEGRRGQVSRILQRRVQAALDVLGEVQDYLDVPIQESNLERYPMDGKLAVLNAVASLKSSAREQHVELVTQLPASLSLVLAEPRTLYEVLETLIQILLWDAYEGSRIEIGLRQEGEWLVYELRNSGFGMPDERFHEYLHGAGEVSTEEFRRLRSAIRQVRDWEGELDGGSEVGVGIHFTLRLKGFM